MGADLLIDLAQAFSKTASLGQCCEDFIGVCTLRTNPFGGFRRSLFHVTVGVADFLPEVMVDHLVYVSRRW